MTSISKNSLRVQSPTETEAGIGQTHLAEQQKTTSEPPNHSR